MFEHSEQLAEQAHADETTAVGLVAMAAVVAVAIVAVEVQLVFVALFEALDSTSIESEPRSVVESLLLAVCCSEEASLT